MALSPRDEQPSVSPLVKPLGVLGAMLVCFVVVWSKTTFGPPAAPPAPPPAPVAPPPPKPLPDVRAGRELEGDTVYRITGVAAETSGTTLHCRALSGGKEVGFTVFVKSGMFGNMAAPTKDMFAKRGVVFRSDGEPSDAVVGLLARLWKTQAKPDHMKDEVPCTAAILQGDTRALARTPAKIKVFVGDGEGTSEKDYGELYLNVNLAKGEAELNEKDPDYREAVLRAFAR
jgi:hypothetical protein